MTGTYSDIIEIVAPASAAAGESVDVTVRIKNIDPIYAHLIVCLCIANGDRFMDQAQNIYSGQTNSYSDSFIMPNHDVTIYASSYYPYWAEWILDDQAQKDVALAEVFEGRISRKELGYDWARANIPAYDIPQGQRGLVHIWGRNDTSSTQRMGIWWQVKDPDGDVVEEYALWEAWPYTGADSEHEFIGDRFDLDKPGPYTIAIQLFMNPDDQVVVDDYYGDLCTVVEAAPPAADLKEVLLNVSKGIYNLGDEVPFTCQYKYKGIAQEGRLTLEIGTGIVPTFFSVHTCSPISVDLEESLDWSQVTIEGTFTLPMTLETGKTYSAKATVEALTDYAIDTDVDYSAFDTVAVPPAANLKEVKLRVTGGTYDLGTEVPFTCLYQYKGIAQKGRLTLEIGTGIVPTFFPVYTCSPISVDLEESLDWSEGTIDGQFTLPLTLEQGRTYSVKATLEALTDYAKDTDVDYSAFDTAEAPPIPPDYELIQHTISHFAYIYDGDAEVNIATFKIDPFTPSAWVAKKFADALESEARGKGARVLETKIYVDTTPLLWTDIRIEVTGTPLGEEVETVAGRGIAVGIAHWLAIILVCLAIIAVIVVATLAFDHWMEKFKKKPGLEDVKPAWGKEALILDIQDAEEYWERPPTPVETLEGMSEAELRDHLDEIAEEEVLPEEISPWLAVAVVGGLGILGAAAAFVLSKPKE